MSTWGARGFSSYEHYLSSAYWKKIKKHFIVNNRQAECYICSSKKSLLLHHVRYDHICEEILNHSVYIICFECHSEIHYVTIFRNILMRTSMQPRHLLRRMRWLRFKKQRSKSWRSVGHFLSYLFT